MARKLKSQSAKTILETFESMSAEEWTQLQTIFATVIALLAAALWTYFSGYSFRKVFRRAHRSVNEFKSESDVLKQLKEASRRCRFDGDEVRDDAFNGTSGDADLALSALSESSDWKECLQTVRFAIQLLATLSDTQRPEHCRRLVEMGAIPILLDCMKKFPLIDEVALCGCAVLASLTDSARSDVGDERMDDDRDALIAGGVLDVLKNVLQNYSASDWTVLMACDAVRGLVDSASIHPEDVRLEARRRAILDSAIMEDISSAVIDHRENLPVAAQSMVTFAVIADCKGSNGDVQSGSEEVLAKRRDYFLTSGAASIIADIVLLHRASEKVRLYGGELLSFLCNGTDAQRNELIKGGVTESLLAAELSEANHQALIEERAKVKAEKAALKKAKDSGTDAKGETKETPAGGTPGASNAAADVVGFKPPSNKEPADLRFSAALYRLGASALHKNAVDPKRSAFIRSLRQTLQTEGEEAIRAWIQMATNE